MKCHKSILCGYIKHSNSTIFKSISIHFTAYLLSSDSLNRSDWIQDCVQSNNKQSTSCMEIIIDAIVDDPLNLSKECLGRLVRLCGFDCWWIPLSLISFLSFLIIYENPSSLSFYFLDILKVIDSTEGQKHQLGSRRMHGSYVAWRIYWDWVELIGDVTDWKVQKIFLLGLHYFQEFIFLKCFYGRYVTARWEKLSC